MTKLLFTLIHYTWCLPQTLVAWIVRVFMKVDHKEKHGHAIVYNTCMKRASVSLGHKIYLCERDWNDEYLIKHEIGHYKQSLMVGWLYLLVIALPSVIWNVWGFERALKKNPEVSYYDYWTEHWADKLGGNLCYKQ